MNTVQSQPGTLPRCWIWRMEKHLYVTAIFCQKMVLLISLWLLRLLSLSTTEKGEKWLSFLWIEKYLWINMSFNKCLPMIFGRQVGEVTHVSKFIWFLYILCHSINRIVEGWLFRGLPWRTLGISSRSSDCLLWNYLSFSLLGVWMLVYENQCQ